MSFVITRKKVIEVDPSDLKSKKMNELTSK